MELVHYRANDRDTHAAFVEHGPRRGVECRPIVVFAEATAVVTYLEHYAVVAHGEAQVHLAGVAVVGVADAVGAAS